MTNEEAMDIMKRWKYCTTECTERIFYRCHLCEKQIPAYVLDSALVVWGNALEKQIPKKPIHCMPLRNIGGNCFAFDDDNYYKCPTCGKEMIMANINKPCCLFCGQSIDWS